MEIMPYVPTPRHHQHDSGESPARMRMWAAVERWASDPNPAYLSVQHDTRGKQWLVDKCCRIIIVSDRLSDDGKATALQQALDVLAEHEAVAS